MNWIKAAGLVLVLFSFLSSNALAENNYVGVEACKECHEAQYKNFMKSSKKATSDKSVKIMASDLSTNDLKECYSCHTTGYGKPGGFVSYESTPELAIAGCEVCHGPGKNHIENSGSIDDIKRKATEEDCAECHSEKRISSFKKKPLLYGGAH